MLCSTPRGVTAFVVAGPGVDESKLPPADLSADGIGVVDIKEGKLLKVLAVSGPERLKTMPEVPTLKEKGINYVRLGWLGICAAAGTPQPIIDQLSRDIAAVVATPEYRAIIEGAGSIAVSSTPAELAQVITQTLDDVAATIQEFGMQQEQ